MHSLASSAANAVNISGSLPEARSKAAAHRVETVYCYDFHPKRDALCPGIAASPSCSIHCNIWCSTNPHLWRSTHRAHRTPPASYPCRSQTTDFARPTSLRVDPVARRVWYRRRPLPSRLRSHCPSSSVISLRSQSTTHR